MLNMSVESQGESCNCKHPVSHGLRALMCAFVLLPEFCSMFCNLLQMMLCAFVHVKEQPHPSPKPGRSVVY